MAFTSANVFVTLTSRYLAKGLVYSSLNSSICAFSTNIDSFFTSSSVRSQRRKRKRAILQQHHRQAKDHNTNNDNGSNNQSVDTRTIKDILFPTPDYGDEPIHNQKRYPKTLAGWRDGIREGWKTYRSTWDGFYTSKGFIVEDKKDQNADHADLKDKISDKTAKVKENVKQNTQFLVQESESVRQKVTDATGISTKEDLRRVAAEMMRLASDCVNEFMAGYRKGRDDEVEKMLTQYFQELDEAANKPRRRKIKRRVLKQHRR